MRKKTPFYVPLFRKQTTNIDITDGGHNAASVYRQLAERHLSPIEWRVHPRYRLPVESLDKGVNTQIPPLIKGYLRLCAMICGEPPGTRISTRPTF